MLTRDDSVQLPQESHSPNSVRNRTETSSSFRLIRCRDIVSENHHITCNLNEACIESSENTSSSKSELPQSIQNGNGSAETDKNQFADGKTDLNISQECQDLEAIILDQSGPDKMDSSHSGKDVHQNYLSEHNEDEIATYNGDYMITHEPSGVMLTSAVPFVAETQSMNDNAYSCRSLPNDKSSGYCIQDSAHEPQHYWAGPVEGGAVDESTPQILPDALQSHLMPNDQVCNQLSEPSDYMPTEKNVCLLQLLYKCFGHIQKFAVLMCCS
jgi:protein lin-54